MPTLELQRGLEAWYEFSPRYFDNQRNQMRDKSGYGRHASANGGPTVGVEGPRSFKATGYDGSDDYFQTNRTFGIGNFAFVCTYNADVLDGTQYRGLFSQRIAEDSGSIFYWADDNNGDARFNVYFDSTPENPNWGGQPTDEWITFVGDWDGSTIRGVWLQDGEVQHVDALDAPNTISDINETMIVGAESGPRRFLDGQISLWAAYSRSLTWPEIHRIGELTAPQRRLV